MMEKEIETAIALVEAGKVSEGLSRLEKAETRVDDDDKFRIAELYYEWGHLKKAKSIAEELLNRYPGESELIFFLAEIMIDTDEEEQAIDMLSNIDSEDADYVRALLLLADIYSSQGLDEVAEQKLLEAKRLSPDEPVVTFALAEFYFSLGNYTQSIPYYEQVLHKGGIPEENVNLRLAEALSGSGKFEDALKFYEKAVGDMSDPESLFTFGMTAYQAGQYQQTIKALMKLKESDPDYSKLYLYLAKAYRAEGALDEALQTAEEGLSIDAFNDRLAYEAGLIALKQGRVERAEQYFRKTLEINSLHHDALKSLAGLLSREGRYEEVIALLGNIEDTEEQDPVFAWYLATAEREEEQFEEAATHYAQAYRGLAEDPVFLEEYGDFLLEEGRREEALTLFRQALSVDPTLFHLEEKIIHFDE